MSIRNPKTELALLRLGVTYWRTEARRVQRQRNRLRSFLRGLLNNVPDYEESFLVYVEDVKTVLREEKKEKRHAR